MPRLYNSPKAIPRLGSSFVVVTTIVPIDLPPTPYIPSRPQSVLDPGLDCDAESDQTS